MYIRPSSLPSKPVTSSTPGKGSYTRASRPAEPTPPKVEDSSSKKQESNSHTRKARSPSLDSVGRIRRTRSSSASSSDASNRGYRRRQPRSRSPTPPARDKQPQKSYSNPKHSLPARPDDQRNGRTQDNGWPRQSQIRPKSPVSLRVKSPRPTRGRSPVPSHVKSRSPSPARSVRSTRRADSPHRDRNRGRSRTRSPVLSHRRNSPRRRSRSRSRERTNQHRDRDRGRTRRDNSRSRSPVSPRNRRRSDADEDRRRPNQQNQDFQNLPPKPWKIQGSIVPSKKAEDMASPIGTGFKRVFKPPSINSSTAQMRKFFPGDEDDSAPSSRKLESPTRASHPLPPKPGSMAASAQAQRDIVSSLPEMAAALPSNALLPPPSFVNEVLSNFDPGPPPSSLLRFPSNVNQIELPVVTSNLPTPAASLPVTPINATPLPSRAPGPPAQQIAIQPVEPILQTKEIYERISQVGEGTYGKVYKARNIEDGTIVALKRIRMEAERDGFPITSVREIKLLQSMRHENVVELTEMMVSHGKFYSLFVWLVD